MTPIRVKLDEAKELIKLFENIYADGRNEWYHVHTTDGKVLIEVNLYYSYVRVYVDYVRDCAVYLDRVSGFDIHDCGEYQVLRVQVAHNPICPFCVEIED